MDAASIQEILLSKPAVALYESVILAILIVFNIIFSKKWRRMKKQQEELLVQKERQVLNHALTNQKRR